MAEQAPEQPAVLTVEEVAAFLWIPARTVRKLLDEGKLPGHKIGRAWRIPRAAVLKYAEAPAPKE